MAAATSFARALAEGAAALDPAGAPSKCGHDADGECHTPGTALGLRVAAVFIILAGSAVGVFAPLALRRWGALAKDRSAFFVFKAFGAGVILATGLVHMFPGAIEMLTSECLGAPSFPVAGAIATASIIFVMLAEHGLAKAAEARLHARLRRMAGPAPAKGAACVPAAGGNIPGHLHGHSHDHAHGTPNKAAAAHPTTTTHHHTHSTDCDDVEAGGQGGERVRAAPHTDACCPPASPVCAGGDLSLATVHGTSQLHAHGHTHGPGEDCVVAARHAAVAQVLEFGIALHSVLIGITLGVLQTACAVRPLLAAITFHQFFEGLALGGCLVEAEYGARAFVGLGTLYALSTPMGVAIGLAIQTSYNPNSPTSLAVSGVFDSISTGILIYMALVDLIAVDFTSSRFRADGRLQMAGYGALVLGAGLMTLLALWA